MPGIVTSPVEVVQITKFGLWLAVGDAEYYLDFKNFPWFQSASITDICDLEEVSPGHLYWQTLDIDLDIETIKEPGLYPLVFKP